MTGPKAMIADATLAVEVQKRIFNKIAWRLLPILSLAYIFNFLDRTNVGFAALTMNHDIGLSASQFGLGAGIFFVSYCLFEVPSNLALYRFGARRWLARIMITWGFASAASALAIGPTSFYAVRLLLGAFEAGFFPGVAYLVSLWFPAEYRARIFAWFLVAVPVSSLISGPVSGLMLGLNGLGGLAGWQWLFILEAVPSVIIGIAFLWLITDHPTQAMWLTSQERQIVVECLASEKRERSIHHFLPAMKDVRVWLLTCIAFGFFTGSYGIQIWLPLIIKQGNFSNQVVGFITGFIYLVAAIGMIFWAEAAGRSGRKIFHLTLTCVISAVGLGVALIPGSLPLSLAGITLALIGTSAVRAIFWSIPPRFLTGTAAAGGIAVINSIGTTGGFFGPSIMGWMKDLTGSFTVGLAVMAGFLIMSAIIAASLRLAIKNE
jgi:MFS family permease